MRSPRLTSLAMAATCVVAAFVPVVGGAAPANAGAPTGETAPGTMQVFYAESSPGETFVPPSSEPADVDPQVGAQSATFVVNYDADFNANPAAKAAFQHAVDLWSELIESPVTIVINAEFNPLGSNILGSAGPNSINRNNCLGPNQMLPDIWYPGPLANALCGSDQNGATTEADAELNKNFSAGGGWYFGLDGNPAGNQWDFVSVAMHEIGHAIGFLGSMSVSGANGSWGFPSFPPTNPMIYDTFAENNLDQNLVTTFGNPSPQLKTQLTSNNIFFDGPNTTAANGGNPAKLYAPGTWQSGSSFSHLDESTYTAGDPNSLMTPILSDGEAIHSPGGITLGILEDMGWALPVPPDPPTDVAAVAGSNAAKVTFTPPVDDGGSDVIQYTVTASPGGAQGVGFSSPVWVAGLENGTPYTFTVIATNAFGDSVPSSASNAVSPALHGFHGIAPVRIVDTRFGTSASCPSCQNLVGARPLNSNDQVNVTQNLVPLSQVPVGADSVVITVTAISPAASGWLTVWDQGSVPNAANLNFAAGQTIANLVTVKLGTSSPGTIRLGNTNNSLTGGPVHVTIDVVGWYDDGVLNTPDGTPYQPVTPERIVDTRFGNGGGCPTCQNIVGARGPGSNTQVTVADEGGVPSSGAVAVVLNVAVTGPTAPGWLTLWPTGSPPNAANLNYAPGQSIAALVTVKLHSDGTIRLGNAIGNPAAGSTHVIIDVVGWYGAAATGGGLNAGTPERILDTRTGVPDANLRSTVLSPQEQPTIQVGGYGRVPPMGVGTVVMNVTAVTPTSQGWFTVWPGGTIPLAASLNFPANGVVANLVIVGLGPDTVKLGNSVGCVCAGFVHAVFDVSGWFAPPPP